MSYGIRIGQEFSQKAECRFRKSLEKRKMTMRPERFALGRGPVVPATTLAVFQRPKTLQNTKQRRLFGLQVLGQGLPHLISDLFYDSSQQSVGCIGATSRDFRAAPMATPSVGAGRSHTNFLSWGIIKN